MKILITGQKGFIGGRFLQRQQEKTHNVYIHFGDLAEIDKNLKFDKIYHFAWRVRNIWEGDFRKDVEIVRILTNMLNTGGTFYFPSTFMVYPRFISDAEEGNENPFTSYGLGKLQAEKIIKKNCDNYLIVRLANVFGFGQTHGIVRNIKIAIKENSKIDVYNPDTINDFVFIDKVLDAFDKLPINKILNVGSGIETSIRQLIEYAKVQYTNRGSDPEKIHAITMSLINSEKYFNNQYKNVYQYIDEFSKNGH